MGPAEDDLDPLADLANVEDDGADALVGMITLAGNLLAARQDAVGLAQVDDDRAPLEPLHRAGDEVAALILELIKETVALGFANLLDDHLLGGLGRDPPEFGRVHLDPVLGCINGAGIPIDVNLDIGRIRIMLPRRRGQRRLNPIEQDILGDILVAVNAVHDPDQIDAHSTLRGVPQTRHSMEHN